MCAANPPTEPQWLEHEHPDWIVNVRNSPKTYETEFSKEKKVSDRGTFGKVYAAKRRQREPDKPNVVALKIQTEQDASVPVAWGVELEALRTVTGHANITQLHGAFFSADMLGSSFTIVTELCLCSLRDRLYYFRTMADEDIRAFSHDMCSGLAHIHAKYVLHRDVKPDNLLLQHVPGQRTVLKICDFGNSALLMKKTTKPAVYCSGIKAHMTTFAYAAPEVLRREQYEFSSDMWSAGVVFFELLQDNPLHPAMGSSIKTAVDALDRMPTFLSKIEEVVTEIPKDLARSMLRGLLESASQKRLTADAALCHDYLRTAPATDVKSASTQGQVSQILR